MSNRGRPRKSIGAHKQDGTFEPSRHEGRMESVAGMPSARGLKLTKDGKWLWDQIIKGLPKECFGSVDTPALRSACLCWQKWIELYDEDFRSALAALAQCERILSKFGWTPSDRAKLHAPAKKGDSQDDRFFGVAG